MEEYYVYMHENKINNKKYIGITCQNPNKRWQNGKKYYSHFKNAIDKYGWDMFKHEILYTNLSKEDACKLEKELILKYKTTQREYGYNNSLGGEIGALGCHYKRKPFTEETKNKMSISKIGNKYALGCHILTKPKNKISEETRKKMRVRSTNKKVRCIETNNIYISTRDAMRKTGILQQSISKNCRGIVYSAGKMDDGTKLHWEYID